MIKLTQNDPNKAVETIMTLAGEEFLITLLPLPLKDQIAAFAPYRKRKNVLNPMTNKMEFVEYFDDKDEKYLTVADELLDKHIITFSGIAGPDGELDGTKRENKLLLGSVKVEDIEEIKVIDPDSKEVVIIPKSRMRHFRALIFDKCNELSETIAEADAKN